MSHYASHIVFVCLQTSNQFMRDMERIIGGTNPLSVTGFVEAPLAYDAVWALALALNKTQTRLVLICLIYQRSTKICVLEASDQQFP